MNENPYASPPQAATSVTPRRVILSRLRIPAIGLLVASGIMLAMYLLNAIAILIPYVTGNRELAQTLLNSLKPFWYAHLGMATGSVIGIYVGIQLLRGRQYTACVIGAILLVIPMISPCFVLAIPFAIWALILLLNKDTRAAFSEVIHSP